MVMVAVLMVSSLLNVVYLLPIPIRGFFGGPPANPGHGNGHGVIKEAPWPCLAAIAVTSLGCLALFFYPDPVYDLLKQIITPPR